MERLALSKLLRNILGTGNVYFQPPENVKIKYPCIVYNLSGKEKKYANNAAYIKRTQYSLTVIDTDPDSPIHERVSDLPHCSFDRAYVSDNLNHWVYNIFI